MGGTTVGSAAGNFGNISRSSEGLSLPLDVFSEGQVAESKNSAHVLPLSPGRHISLMVESPSPPSRLLALDLSYRTSIKDYDIPYSMCMERAQSGEESTISAVSNAI